MLNIDDALRLVLNHCQVLPPKRIPAIDASGCVLDEEIVSDIDSPPHDKAIVDGYAVIAADVSSPGVELRVLEEVMAGAVPTKAVEPGAATRIMTGAPLPAGADAVVMIEQSQLRGEKVVVHAKQVKCGQNIMRRGAAMQRGQILLQSGTRLRPIEIGLLAEVGRTDALVFARPSVGVIATGNELVPVNQVPRSGQIRNSNGPMLAALARQAGAISGAPAIAADDKDRLRSAILAGLSCDVLLLSGGVSAGVLDLVPAVLQELDVQQVFHKVNLKPGKPLWFGVQECGGQHKLVFGLPGNPVSSLVCFELFVRPAIQKLRGLPPTGLPRRNGRLAIDHQQRGDRPTYWPAAICEDEIKPLPWKGSGDLRTLADANCLAFFPAGERIFRAGEEVSVLRFAEP